MTEYRFHWLVQGSRANLTPSVVLEAPTTFHGAALALLRFLDQGCDMGAPGAHIDVSDSDGAKHTILVEELFDWLKRPEQTGFVQREGLAVVLQQGQV
jgi:hypothetical protein